MLKHRYVCFPFLLCLGSACSKLFIVEKETGVRERGREGEKGREKGRKKKRKTLGACSVTATAAI